MTAETLLKKLTEEELRLLLIERLNLCADVYKSLCSNTEWEENPLMPNIFKEQWSNSKTIPTFGSSPSLPKKVFISLSRYYLSFK